MVLVLAFVMCTFTVPSVSAGSLAFDMNQLGITEGMTPETREAEYVKRDEFAQMVANMMQQKDVAKSLENAAYFTDIADSQYKGAINMLAQLGYISGSGTGTYAPNDYLTYGAACKILVHALGYDKITEDASLSSYQFVAGTIKLTDGIDSSVQYMSFAQTMKMIDNALDIGMMVPVYYNANIAPSYEVDEDRTLRSMFYGRNGTGVVKMRGKVTADVSTFMYTPRENMKDTQIEIAGKLYNYDGVAPLGFVGQEVDYYITVDNYEEGVVSAISPTNKNVVYDFEGSQVTEVTSNEIEFEADAKYTVKIDSSTRYIYNNRLALNYKLSVNDNVVLRTVDNDEDEVAELVFVYEYTNCVVDTVYASSNTIVLKDGYTLGKEKNLQLDDEEIYYEIYDAKGRLTDLSAITEDAVVSIARATDKSCIRIVVCTDTAEGDIISKSDDEVVVGNTTYLCAETIDLENIKIGANVTVYLNFLGKIVAYDESESADNYAYVYMYNKSSGLGNYKVKLLLPALISIKKVEGETDEMSGEVSTSQSLFVRNSDVVLYEAESKIIYNGKKQNAETVLAAVLENPVAYGINENGRIYKIDTLDPVDDVQIKINEVEPDKGVNLFNKTYNGTELIFGGNKGGAFAIQKEHTLAFCVPKYTKEGQTKDNLSDDDLKVIVELMNNVDYEANGYEQDEDTLIADVLVVQQIMQSGQAGAVLGTSDVGMVLKSSKKLDAEGNEVNAVTMITDDEEKTFTVSPLISNQKAFENLQMGDLIAYTLDGFDRLDGVTVLQGKDDYYNHHEADRVCGEIKDIEYNRISKNRVRWVHNVHVGYDSESTTVDLLVRNPAPIFVMETDKKVRAGSIEDLQIGDKVFVSLNLANVRAIVIKR